MYEILNHFLLALFTAFLCIAISPVLAKPPAVYSAMQNLTEQKEWGKQASGENKIVVNAQSPIPHFLLRQLSQTSPSLTPVRLTLTAKAYSQFPVESSLSQTENAVEEGKRLYDNC